MKRRTSLPAILAGAFLVLMMIGVPAGYAGSLRYGGPEGLVQRVQAEIAERRPHPDYVPTPFTAGVADVAPAPAADNPSPEPPQIADARGVAAASLPLIAESDAAGSSVLATPTRRPQRSVTSTPASKVAATATTTATITATVTYRAPQPSVALKGLAHYWQTWNNCGPATLAMNLSFYGSKITQADIAAVLRTQKDDKNVGPEEMAGYVRSQGFGAVVRVNGDAERLRTLLSNDIPVLIETWLEPKPNDGMGHYRLLTGYDDETQQWIAYDSYDGKGLSSKGPYAGIRLSYAELDSLWHVFNRVYVVVYTEKQAPLVQAILGSDVDDTAMWQRSLVTADAAIAANPNDAFAHYNRGSSLTMMGRFQEAAAAFDQARVIKLPWRMLWYQFEPFKVYYEVQRYQEVVALSEATLRSVGGDIEELQYWRGMGLQALGNTQAAREALQRAVRLNPHYEAPAAALAALGN